MDSAESRRAADDLGELRPGSIPGLPKYAQLRETLLQAISNGRWKPGDRLPTETDLAQRTRLSLGTVQRALRALADEGVVIRAQGSGTFVAQGRASIDAPLHLRFIGGEGEPRFLPLFPKTAARKRIAERGPWSDWLRQRGADIVRVDRRLSVNGEFAVFNRFYFSATTFPDIADMPLAALDANLKQLLAGSLRAPITHVEQRVSLLKLPPEICKAIDVKAGVAGMLLESAASAGRANPIYFLESYIPPNHRRLDVSVP